MATIAPKLITQEELRTGVGIGASEVAAIMHLSPYQSAYDLFQIKTGRREKLAPSAAMKYGMEAESAAFAEYVTKRGLFGMQRQVAAVHSEMSFLRAIADGWDGHQGVEIKCPTSKRLINAARKGAIPPHYALQLAAEMETFGVTKWDFFVYEPGGASQLLTVSIGDPCGFSACSSLREYWVKFALPAIQDFWKHMCEDSWEFSAQAEVDAVRWTAAIEKRQYAQEMISDYQDLQREADSELKQLVGASKAVSCAGFNCAWIPYKPTWGIKIAVESAQVQQDVLQALEVLKGTKGVVSVKAEHQPDRRVFRVDELS